MFRRVFLSIWFMSLTLAVGLLLVAGTRAQERTLKGFRFFKNERGLVTAVEYFGTCGLRAAELEKLPELKRVVVAYGTALTADDVTCLATLTNLTELVIGQETIDPPVTIEGDLSPLSALQSLKFLHLCKHDMKDDDLAFVAGLPRLVSLEFNANSGTRDSDYHLSDRCGDFIGKARALKRLTIQEQGEFSDALIAKLSGLSELEHLTINADGFTDESLRLLAAHSAQLKSLDMSSQHFTDAGVLELAKLKQLEQLWLHSEQLTSSSLTAIQGLEQLKHLSLSISEVTDEGMKAISALQRLELLVLRQVVFEDQQFAFMRGHPALSSIFINGDKLTESVTLDVIRSMPSLSHVDVGRKNSTLQAAANKLLMPRKEGH